MSIPSLTFERRYRVQIREPDSYNITLVGCGGTGSFLALHLARLAYHARERYGYDVRLFFVDPDVVEVRNIGRQNFCPAELGYHKAWSLMQRYNVAFGLNTVAWTVPFEEGMLRPQYYYHAFNLVVGAVDNTAARRDIDKAVRGFNNHQLYWLDCGNHEHSGQVLLGNRGDIGKPQIALDTCAGLPLPSIQHPELIKNQESRIKNQGTRIEDGESCAELTVNDVQSLMINQAMATWAAQYVYRLVIARDLDVYATYLDLETGSVRSLGIIK